MKLTELDPHWITGKRSNAEADVLAQGKRGDIGITFQCPCCIGTERATRLAVLFDPPIDDGVLWLWATWNPVQGLRWARTGETFETITLTPSINASNSGHWHGFITNGDVTRRSINTYTMHLVQQSPPTKRLYWENTK